MASFPQRKGGRGIGRRFTDVGTGPTTEFLDPSHLTNRELARRMGVTSMRVNEIIQGKRAITADTALRLAKVFGTSAKFWMNLQINRDLAQAAIAQREAA